MFKNTFNHSVKVPKLYKAAAKITEEVAEGGGGIKQLVYEKKHFNTKALYALVVTAFQKAKEIDLLFKRTQLFSKEPRLDPWLARILISELLWGKKQLPKNESKPIQTILAYEQQFKAHLSDTSKDLLPEKSVAKKPRYVRINTLLTTVNESIDNFQSEGWTLHTHNLNDYNGFLNKVANLEGDIFLKDIHIPDLLIFPPGTEFYGHPGYKAGSIILQDKASCLPVHILAPVKDSIVLDMCAAPGMKTTQLAAALNDQGTVYAVERDQRRFQILNKMIESSGATCIKAINRDVLECGDVDFPGVEYILVDPSCTGSGMTDRLEFNQTENYSRLSKLAGFQIKILRSALTRYPQAKRVVYSTCSLYPDENEDVVRQVLETNENFKLVPAGKFVNDVWKNFGSPYFGDIGKFCLYAKPEEDYTNGFFVAVFERLEDGENNRFFNGNVFNYRKNVERKQARKEGKVEREAPESIDDETQRIDGGNFANEGGAIKRVLEVDDSKKNVVKRKRKHSEIIVDNIVEGNGDICIENLHSTKQEKKHKKSGKNSDNSGKNSKVREGNLDNERSESFSGGNMKKNKKKKKRKHSENEADLVKNSEDAIEDTYDKNSEKKKKRTKN